MGRERGGCLRKGLPGKRQKGDTLLFTLEGKVTLKQVVEQGFAGIREQFLGQLKRVVKGLLVAERDRRIAEFQRQGQKVYRWGYTVRKCG